MRDYTVQLGPGGLFLPVADHSTRDLEIVLRWLEVTPSVQSSLGQCTREQMMERIKIELHWRSLNGGQH